MSDTGWVAAGTGTNDAAEGDQAWSTPENITADDGSNATSNPDFAKTTQTLVGTNFGFSIPTGSTIDGIEVLVQATGDTATHTTEINVRKDGSTVGTEKSQGVAYTTTMTDFTFGSVSDLWDLSVTAAEVNSSNFGTRFRILDDASFAVDVMKIKVTYTEAPAEGKHRMFMVF